jgi:hypothetical protein
LLGCGGRAEDSVEHYARCRIIRGFAAKFMNFRISEEAGLQEFMVASMDVRWSTGDEDLTRLAVLIYSAYRATNTARRLGGVQADVAEPMLAQTAKEAVQGHLKNATILDNGRAAGHL